MELLSVSPGPTTLFLAMGVWHRLPLGQAHSPCSAELMPQLSTAPSLPLGSPRLVGALYTLPQLATDLRKACSLSDCPRQYPLHVGRGRARRKNGKDAQS